MSADPMNLPPAHFFQDEDLQEIKSMAALYDRSIKLVTDPTTDPDWLDHQFIVAHLATPLWSDYAIVRDKPDMTIFYGLIADMLLHGTTTRENFQLPIFHDDSFIVTDLSAIQMLATCSRIPVDNQICYMMAYHFFRPDRKPIALAGEFHHFTASHGLVAYPDSDLIDEHQLWRNGTGAAAYLDDPRRQRPLFIARRTAQFPKHIQEFHMRARSLLAGFGTYITNDALFRELADLTAAHKTSVIAVYPDREMTEIAAPNVLCDELNTLLATSDLITAPTETTSLKALGNSAKAAWLNWMPHEPICPDDIEICRDRAARVIDFTEKYLTVREATPNEIAPRTPLPAPIEPTREHSAPKPVALDDHGWPTDLSDFPRWAEQTYPDSIIIHPRAAKALVKSSHPDPQRIAKAIDLLATIKLDTYRGDRTRNDDLDAALLDLRLRDSFSNAESLRGQTGDDYQITIDGRKLLLSRHLASSVSGMNDARLIRVYYVYDKQLDRIVIGWLPTHLRNTKT